MTEQHVAMRGVLKSFRRNHVLTGFDLEVAGGEVVALVGENGQGKTTALKILAGLLDADEGDVSLGGRVGYCPQTPGLVDHLTVDEHLVLFGTAAGMSRTHARQEGRSHLESVGMASDVDEVAKHLSGGTRQKLNLALALLGDPSVLLLDEPYQGFDLGSYVDFWGHVHTWRSQGRAVVVVTHLLTDASVVDRVVEVRDGRAVDVTDRTAEVVLT